MRALLDHAPLISLLFFFGVFVWIAYRTYRPSNKKRLQSLAYIPLSEDEHEQR